MVSNDSLVPTKAGKHLWSRQRVLAVGWQVILPCVCHYIPTNWLRATINSGDREFEVPSNYPLTAAGYRTDKISSRFLLL